jgi:trk system potassium uptake protein TrkH
VATACGGVKLLRLYVLVVAFRRELEQASLPNLVPRQDLARFSLSEAAPRAAWVFLMMFLFALAVTTVAFGYLGLGFENAMIYAVSALSTTGPMIVFSQEMGADLTTASQGVKWVYCVAMIAGRFEMLAILTLFAPNLWRS